MHWVPRRKDDMTIYWEDAKDAKDAVNEVLNREDLRSGDIIEDWVGQIYNNRLPKAIDAAILLLVSHRIGYDDSNLKILIDAYNQYNELGYLTKRTDKD